MLGSRRCLLRLQHHGAVPAVRGDHPVARQQLVGLGDGAPGQAEVGRLLADRGKASARPELPGDHEARDLQADLFDNGHGRRRVDLQHGSHRAATRNGTSNGVEILRYELP